MKRLSGGRIHFGVLDASTGAHGLHDAGLHATLAASTVFVQLRTLRHDGTGLHLAVRVHWEADPALDDVVCEAAELTEVRLIWDEGIPRLLPYISPMQT